MVRISNDDRVSVGVRTRVVNRCSSFRVVSKAAYFWGFYIYICTLNDGGKGRANAGCGGQVILQYQAGMMRSTSKPAEAELENAMIGPAENMERRSAKAQPVYSDRGSKMCSTMR
jgi:hypothetical protein